MPIICTLYNAKHVGFEKKNAFWMLLFLFYTHYILILGGDTYHKILQDS